MELPYDPAILFLNIYMKKTKTIQKDICTPICIATLFITVKIWKQPRCPFIDEWIKDVEHVYNGILLDHKKEWTLAICNNMDGSRGHYAT